MFNKHTATPTIAYLNTEVDSIVCCSPSSDTAQINNLNTCPNTWVFLFHCDSSPHYKITIDLQINYSRLWDDYIYSDLSHTLTKEEMHAGLKCLSIDWTSGCGCITEDIYFSVKTLLGQKLFGLNGP